MGDNYNVYNNFDSNFINYGELYKTPQGMKMNSKKLIGDYADALIKGPSDVYIDSPNLAGNRYFINTHTLCANKENINDTNERSILVDNVMKSALNQTKGGNKGLIYSLIASMKTLDTNAMFLDMSNNQPTSFDKHSPSAYLSKIDETPMPLCSKVSVYGDDKRSDIISGWVTKEDKQKIDPAALAEVQKEGYINMGDYVKAGQTPNDFAAQTNKLHTAMQEQSDTIQDETRKNSKKYLDQAQAQIKKHNKKGTDFSVSAASENMDRVKKNREEGGKRGDKAKQSGQGQMLKMKTEEFLVTNKPTGGVGYSTLELLTTLINSTFNCGEDGGKKSRIPSACIKVIFSKDVPPNQPSKDATRTNLCEGQTFNEISVQNFADDLINSVKTNQDNTDTLKLPELPSQLICIRVPIPLTGMQKMFGAKQTNESKPINGYDYGIYESALEIFRPLIAREIVRYRNVGVFGQCKAVANKSEGFTTQLLTTPTNKIDCSLLSTTSYFYIIILVFLFFYIVYSFLMRVLRLDKSFKFKPLKM